MKTILTALILILISLISLSAKPVLEIKLLNRIDLTEATKEFSSYGLLPTETGIIVFDASDTTATKVCSYDYSGNRIDNYRYPKALTEPNKFFFRYLFGRKQIAVGKDLKCNFYSLESKLVKTRDLLSDSTYYMPDGWIADVVEYNDTLYYKYWRLQEAAIDRTEPWMNSMTWYKENDGKLQPLVKMFYENSWQIKLTKPPAIFPWLFSMDTNRDKELALVQEFDNHYLVRFGKDNEWIKFKIRRSKQDHLLQVFTGEDYIVLNTVTDKWKQSPASGIYNLSGKKVCSLSKVKEINSSKKYLDIADIVGNKLIVSDKINKLVKIYQVNSKN